MNSRPIAFTMALAMLVMLSTSPVALAAEPKVIFQDNFAKLDAGWGESSDLISAKDGVLTIRPKAGTVQLTQHQGFLIEDANINVNVRSVKNEGNAFPGGLIFWAENYSSYYIFVITPSGKYAVMRYVKNRWLSPVSYRESEAIKKGLNQDNELRVKLSGKTATFFINGKEVISITGLAPEGGGFVGMYTESGAKEQTATEFRNLKITALK
jgi:hypothetical protein